jgi:hypothetical protein
MVVLVVKLWPETQGALSMRLESRKEGAAPKLSGRRVFGRCLCGAVELEIDFPAFWPGTITPRQAVARTAPHMRLI